MQAASAVSSGAAQGANLDPISAARPSETPAWVTRPSQASLRGKGEGKGKRGYIEVKEERWYQGGHGRGAMAGATGEGV